MESRPIGDVERGEIVALKTLMESSLPLTFILFFTLIFRPTLLRSGVTQDLLLGRWRLTLELFGRVFIDDVGAEPGSIIAQLGGFPVKEAKFRREMEKLRNGQQRDMNLTKVREAV